jgi:sugar phosphate isomerase/epimerase
MIDPKLVLCNFLSHPRELKALAQDHGFSGVDWSFDLETLPDSPAAESSWAQTLFALDPLEIRYHCPFYRLDLGHDDPREAAKAANLFRRIIRLVSKVNGRFLTVHIGLGYDSTQPLSWDVTISNLRDLVYYGASRKVSVCLENLAWGWTSKPNLFEKLVRGSGAGVTFDIGHAHASEVIRSHYFSPKDFVSPHKDCLYNAHVYHTERSGLGHVPPDQLTDVRDRLDILGETRCDWWVLEVREINGLLQTKRIVDEYLKERRSR